MPVHVARRAVAVAGPMTILLIKLPASELFLCDSVRFGAVVVVVVVVTTIYRELARKRCAVGQTEQMRNVVVGNVL